MKNSLKHLIQNLKSSQYYLTILFNILGTSFIAFIWLYLKKEAAIETPIKNIVIYFGLISVFHFIFTYNLVNKLQGVFTTQLDEALLHPKGIMAFCFNEMFIPVLIKSAAPGVLIYAAAYLSGTMSCRDILLSLVLLLFSCIYYFFFSITMTVVSKFLKWEEYMGFSLRFIGFVWNGSYIPFIFYEGLLKRLLTVSPFAATGLFLQPAWQTASDNLRPSSYLLPAIFWFLFWIITSQLTVKAYLKVKR
jgi:hypothetical protein